MHGPAGEAAGWGDEVVLGGVVLILAAFLAWGWWKERAAR